MIFMSADSVKMGSQRDQGASRSDVDGVDDVDWRHLVVSQLQLKLGLPLQDEFCDNVAQAMIPQHVQNVLLHLLVVLDDHQRDGHEEDGAVDQVLRQVVVLALLLLREPESDGRQAANDGHHQQRSQPCHSKNSCPDWFVGSHLAPVLRTGHKLVCASIHKSVQRTYTGPTIPAGKFSPLSRRTLNKYYNLWERLRDF